MEKHWWKTKKAPLNLWVGVKEKGRHWHGAAELWAQALLLDCCAVLGMLLNLTVLQFPYLSFSKIGMIITAVCFCRLVVKIKWANKSKTFRILAYRKCYINVGCSCYSVFLSFFSFCVCISFKYSKLPSTQPRLVWLIGLSASEPKGCQFIPSKGICLGYRPGPRLWAWERHWGNRWMFLWHIT